MVIKQYNYEYFKNYFLHNSDFEINLKNNKLKMLNSISVDWKVVY